jgi:hypothetical protein
MRSTVAWADDVGSAQSTPLSGVPPLSRVLLLVFGGEEEDDWMQESSSLRSLTVGTVPNARMRKSRQLC